MKKNMKRWVSLVLSLLLILGISVPVCAMVDTEATFSVESDSWKNWPQSETIDGKTAIVMDADSGEIFYAKGMDEKRYPASITKVMTSLLIVENCSDMNAIVTMTETGMADAYAGSSNVLPTLGEQFTVEQCLQMILVKSANDISTQMAEYVGGSVQAFVDMMNAKAAELGCSNTHFSNANGLENLEHFTSAHDMALIMQAAIQYDKIREIMSMQSVTIPATNCSQSRTYQTHVLMIDPGSQYYYQGCLGGKTGYTDISASTLVVYAERNGRRLIGCVMGGIDSNLICVDMQKVLDYGYCKFYPLDVTYGCQMLSGGQVYVPEGVTTGQLEIKAESADSATNLTYYLGDVYLGKASLSNTEYEKYLEKRSAEVNPSNTKDGGKAPVTVVDDKEATNETDDGAVVTSAKKTNGSKTHLVLYIIIGVLAALILLAIILIFASSIIRSKRRKNKKRRK